MRVIKNPDIFRTNVKKKLSSRLKTQKMAENLEKGIFNYVVR